MTTTTQREYDMIGYSVLRDYPQIINGIIIKNNDSGIQMKVSVREAQSLVDKGKMDVPNPEPE